MPRPGLARANGSGCIPNFQCVFFSRGIEGETRKLCGVEKGWGKWCLQTTQPHASSFKEWEQQAKQIGFVPTVMLVKAESKIFELETGMDLGPIHKEWRSPFP